MTVLTHSPGFVKNILGLAFETSGFDEAVAPSTTATAHSRLHAQQVAYDHLLQHPCDGPSSSGGLDVEGPGVADAAAPTPHHDKVQAGERRCLEEAVGVLDGERGQGGEEGVGGGVGGGSPYLTSMRMDV